MSADKISDEMRVSLASDYVRQNFETGEPWSMTIARAIVDARAKALEEAAAYHDELSFRLRGSPRQEAHRRYATDIRALQSEGR